MPTFITPTNVSPATTGAWQDIDVSTLVPEGASGVILRIENGSGYYDYNVGWRKNSSTDNDTTKIYLTNRFWAAVGLDTNRVFEFYRGNSAVAVYLVGYFMSEAVFFTNRITKTISGTGAWHDVDISSDAGSDTAIAALIELDSDGGYNQGLRPNNSSDNRIHTIKGHRGVVVGVDANEIFEFYTGDSAKCCYLTGYLIAGATMYTNATDVSKSSTDWGDLAALSEGAIGGIYEVVDNYTQSDHYYRYNLRAKGSTAETTWGSIVRRHAWAMVQCDIDRVVEGYINNTYVHFYLLGYFTPERPFTVSADTCRVIAVNPQAISFSADTFRPVNKIGAACQYLTKVEWLNWAEDTVLGDYTADVLDGSYTGDISQDIQRSFSLTVDNSGGLYVPYGARTNMGVKVRLKRGILTSNGPYWWSRGIYVLSDPSAVHKGAEQTVTLQGMDKWALFDGTLGGKILDTEITIAINTNIGDAIRGVAELAGETKFAFDVCTETTPYTITKEAGSTYADLIKELALIPSWYIGYDLDGYLRFCPLADPVQKQVYTSLAVDGEYRYCYISGQYNPEWSKIRNKWKVIGYSDSDTGEIFDGTAENNNPDSPTNTSDPPNGIGIKGEVITDTNIVTDSLCEQRAIYELRANLTKIDRSSHEILPLPFLNPGDCILLEDTNNGIPLGKYEIQSINEPLNPGGVATIECWQCVSIFELVCDDNFQLGVGEWEQLADGSVDIYGFAGNNCLRKTTSADPNGGYRLLDKTVTDFEFICYTRRDATGTGDNSYSITDSSGNGYGISLTFDGTDLLRIDRRTAWAASSLGTDSYTPSLGAWYTLRLVKVGSNLTAELYSGKETDFTNPDAVVDTVDTNYATFTQVSVNGGNTYYTDDVKVRRLL